MEARVSFIGPALHASSIRVDLGATFRDRKTLRATVTTVTKTLESLCPRFYRASHKYASTFPAPVQLGFGPLDFFNAPNLAFWCCKTATGFALFGKRIKKLIRQTVRSSKTRTNLLEIPDLAKPVS